MLPHGEMLPGGWESSARRSGIWLLSSTNYAGGLVVLGFVNGCLVPVVLVLFTSLQGVH